MDKGNGRFKYKGTGRDGMRRRRGRRSEPRVIASLFTPAAVGLQQGSRTTRLSATAVRTHDGRGAGGGGGGGGG